MKKAHILSAIAALIASPMLMAGSMPVSDSGLVSLANGESAVLNVVNIDPTVGSSCKIGLSFLDHAGSALVAAQEVMIAAGGSASASLPAVNSGPQPIRAHIDYSPQLLDQTNLKDPLAGCYNLIPTLEVLAADGSTKLIVTDFFGVTSIGDKPMKIDICHNASKKNPHTNNISISAWKAHQGHGDTLGPCPSVK